MSYLQDFTFRLPDWLLTAIEPYQGQSLSADEQMGLAIKLSELNIEQGGGPFGALIVDLKDNTLIAAGVNLVVSHNLSCAHAEMVAISMAQQSLDCYRLADRGEYQLVTSCEPCAMCFGAIPWSGVKSVLCGAYKADAEAVGFDEGPKLEAWIEALQQRGIVVKTGIRQPQARAVLQAYAQLAGVVY